MSRRFRPPSSRVDDQKLNQAAQDLLLMATRVLGPNQGPCDKLRYITQLLLCVPEDAPFCASDVLLRCYEELFGRSSPDA